MKGVIQNKVESFRKIIDFAVTISRFLPRLGPLLIPALAHAQTVSGGASPQTMVNNICTFLLGEFGQSIAIIALIVIGFLFAFGRASVGIIAGIISGILIMFGASYLGAIITGGG